MLKRILLSAFYLFTALNCVSTKKAPTTSEEVVPVSKPEVYFMGTVIRDNINIRSTSSTDGSIQGKVNDGEQVGVLQNKEGWYQIVTNSNIEGWVRSDFIGTKTMSYRLKSENFADNTLQDLNVKMFIDENDPYEVIYMILPENSYNDKNNAQNFVKQLGRQYQEKVYPGRIEIRVLKRDGNTLFDRVNLEKQGAVNLKAPLLTRGRLYSFDLVDGYTVIIKALIPQGLSDDILYDMSRDISANYGIDIRKIEIYFIEEDTDGLNYLNNSDYKPQEQSSCRFYYLEDKNGPYYESNFCE